MTAEEFTAFVRYVREEYGVFENALAKSMGFSRQVLAKWRKKGSPAYADLVAAAVIAGLDPWRPERGHLPNPALRQAAKELEHSSHTEE
jgi:hypothetical protein